MRSFSLFTVFQVIFLILYYTPKLFLLLLFDSLYQHPQKYRPGNGDNELQYEQLFQDGRDKRNHDYKEHNDDNENQSVPEEPVFRHIAV